EEQARLDDDLVAREPDANQRIVPADLIRGAREDLDAPGVVSHRRGGSRRADERSDDQRSQRGEDSDPSNANGSTRRHGIPPARCRRGQVMHTTLKCTQPTLTCRHPPCQRLRLKSPPPGTDATSPSTAPSRSGAPASSPTSVPCRATP